MTFRFRAAFSQSHLAIVSAVALLIGVSLALVVPSTQARAATVTSTTIITIPGYVDGQRGSVQIAPNGAFAYAAYATKSAINTAPTWKLARIDLTTNTVVSSIVTSFEVTSIAFTDDSSIAYVAGVDGSSNFLAKYTTSDGALVATSSAFGSAGGAATVALDVVSGVVQPYVATRNGGLYRIGADLSAVKIIATTAGAISDGMAGFVISRDTHFGYVAGQDVSKVFTLNTATDTFTAATSSAAVPFSLALSSNGQRLMVSHAGSSGVVTEIDLNGGTPTVRSFTMTSTTRAGDAGIALSPGGTELYVPSMGNDIVSAVDLDATLPNAQQLATTPSADQPIGISMSADGGILLVANVRDLDDFNPSNPSFSTSTITRINLDVPAPAPTPTPDPVPVPEPAASTTPTVTPTVAPVVIPTTAPAAAPVELPAGTGGALINGVATPVTVAAAPGGKAVVVSAGGVSVEVGATGPDGAPLPLAPDGSLIVAESGGVQMGGAGFSPNSTVSLFLYSTPTKLGELPVSASGTYSGAALIPAGVDPGSHTIQAVGYTPSGATLALSVGVTVKSAAAIRGASPVVKATAGVKTAGASFVATATGVQSRCTVRFWTKGSSATVKAGVAGRAQTTLQAPTAPGTWTLTATVSGAGCERRVTKSTYRVSRA